MNEDLSNFIAVLIIIVLASMFWNSLKTDVQKGTSSDTNTQAVGETITQDQNQSQQVQIQTAPTNSAGVPTLSGQYIQQ